ncbi:hypothetical protein [Microbacterium gorillae]|uniref:hypothetical protein n=1 Tax=Microbacterium gorillae TaxID=1231063 RepID=UPI003D9696CA
MSPIVTELWAWAVKKLHSRSDSAGITRNVPTSRAEPQDIHAIIRLNRQQALLLDICVDRRISFIWLDHGMLAIEKLRIEEVITQLNRRAARILGAEGCELYEKDIWPRLDMIYDIDAEHPKGTISAMLEAWPEDVWIDLTLDVAESTPVGYEMNRLTLDHAALAQICVDLGAAFVWFSPGTMTIDKRYVRDVLAELTRRNIRVLGAEGFELRGKEIWPQLDMIYAVDVSNVKGTLSEVVESWPDSVWVDLTLET